MTEHGTKKEVEDPEDILRRKFHMKCLFRAIGRLAISNAYWLIEDSGHYQNLEDVKRRVEQAVRGKVKRKRLLSINIFQAIGRLAMYCAYWLIEVSDHYQDLVDVTRRVEQAVLWKVKRQRLRLATALQLSYHSYQYYAPDKTLLNKPAMERTEAERKYLYRIIGGLKCFKRYPNHVKKKLAAVTYFKYYGPGRTIVRQHHEAHALYFIVTGDVVVSQMVFDDLLQRHVSVEVSVMHPGDMFGEVSLLHNIPRTATVTTTGHCELLALMKEDFKHVLQASVQKQWDEVRLAMSAFTYFDSLDQVAFREGCIMAKMKSYEVNETILGDGVAVPNFVYFILSGRCQMIESLQVIVTSRLGRDYYALYDPFIPKEESEQDIIRKYFAALNTPDKVSHVSDNAMDNTVTDTVSRQINPSVSKTGRSSLVDTWKETRLSSDLKPERRSSSIRAESAYVSEMDSLKINVSDSKDLLKPTQQDQWRESLRLSTPPQVPENLRMYFMQVCQLLPGSSFGFGENMRDRRIVALTRMECLLLPKVWLLQRNTANIWTRIQHYLDMKIPSKKQLFKEFVSARRWVEYRDQIVTDVVARSHTVNATSVHDVPYSIRTEDMLDL